MYVDQVLRKVCLMKNRVFKVSFQIFIKEIQVSYEVDEIYEV